MSISDRLDQIEQREQRRARQDSIFTPAHTDVPVLLAAVRAVLAIDTGDNRNVYGIDFEAGMVKSLWIVHQTIAAALGCGDGIDTTPERVHETPNREHIGEARDGQ